MSDEQIVFAQDWQATEKILSADAIRQSGEYHLYRALNTRQLIGFLGSGVSAAYGRVGWTDLALSHTDGLKKAIPKGKREGKDRTGQLFRQLEALTSKGRDMASEDVVIALQTCEQIWVKACGGAEWEGLVAQFSLKRHLTQFEMRNQKGEELARSLFRCWLKRETHDEWPHIVSLLAGGGGDKNTFMAALTKEPEARKDQAKDILKQFSLGYDLNRERADDPQRNYALLYNNNFVIKSKLFFEKIQFTDTNIQTLKYKISDYLNNISQNTIKIGPSRFYAISLVFDLIRLMAKADGGDLKQTEKKLATLVRIALLKGKGNVARAQAIPESMDPLHHLVHGLEIRRFATLNYDLEVEKFHADMGYARQADPSPEQDGRDISLRTGPRGGRARDIVLNRRTATDFIDFATSAHEFDHQIVHLHGRATDDSDIVVTEHDYQRKYVRESRSQAVFRHGMDICFGGNPILFAGVGLSEDDVLRPLREFMAGMSRRNRSIIALLPATKPKEKRDAEAFKRYAKYGVHTIYYGFGKDSDSLSKTLACLKYMKEEINLKKEFSEMLDNIRKKTKELKEIDVKNNKKINIEINAIEVLISAARAIENVPSAIIYKNKNRRYWKEMALRHLDQIETSIRTLAFTAELKKIRGRWQKWKAEMEAAPESRSRHARYSPASVTASSSDQTESADRATADNDPNIWTRHMTKLEDSKNADLLKQEEKRLVDNSEVWLTKPAMGCGRRVVVLAGERGSGKGLLFYLLTRTTEISTARGLRYKGQFFTSFSFASEASSVWDALIQFLIDHRNFSSLKDIGEKRQYPLLEADFSGWSRLKQLDYALARLSKEKTLNDKRLLIVFSAVDMLFDKENRPKNAQIGQMMSLLLDKRHEKRPFDLVLIGRTERLPDWLFAPLPQTDSPQFRAAIPFDKQEYYSDEDIHRAFATIRSRKLNILRRGAIPDNNDYSYDKGSLKNYFTVLQDDKHILHILPYTCYYNTFGTSNRETPGSKQFREVIIKILGNNRFLLNLAMQVVDKCDSNGQQKLVRDIKLLPSLQGHDNADVFIGFVLDFWSREDNKDSSTAKNPCLYEEIITHLGVIAAPVEPDVLLVCPRIREILQGNKQPANGKEIEKHLKTLKERGLVFEIEPRNLEDGSNKTSRYQVHRAIEGFIYRKLGSAETEPTDGYNFAPSIFIAQARENPRLNASSYQFIYELVDALTAYPTRSGAGLPKGAGRKSRCLRAALGVVRTLFSIGIISRMTEVDALPFPKPPQLGYVERHRLVVRWMLEAAKTIATENDPNAGSKFKKYWPPFYRDELVWLRNECAVLSMAKGNVFDAKAQFDLARTAMRKIEGENGGPMLNRISLNAAFCDIDRGRISAARAKFQYIHNTSGHERLLNAIALGGLAQCDHIGGRIEDANVGYKTVIETITSLHRIRPLAYFARLHGDLLRHMGDYAGAKTLYEQSLQAAYAGPYLDFVHATRVAMAKADLREIDLGKERHFHLVPEQANKFLEEAESYADRMEIPRLICEATLIRAERQYHYGETLRAAQLAARVVRIANLNGLVMRAIAGLELLSRIYARQTDIAGSARLRQSTIRSARRVGYNLIASRAD